MKQQWLSSWTHTGQDIFQKPKKSKHTTYVYIILKGGSSNYSAVGLTSASKTMPEEIMIKFETIYTMMKW